MKPSSCRKLHGTGGWPGNTKIASGLVIQEPVPQTEQPPSGGIFGQTPGGAGTIGGLVGSGDGAKVGTNALHSQTPITGGMEGQKAKALRGFYYTVSLVPVLYQHGHAIQQTDVTNVGQRTSQILLRSWTL